MISGYSLNPKILYEFYKVPSHELKIAYKCGCNIQKNISLALICFFVKRLRFFFIKLYSINFEERKSQKVISIFKQFCIITCYRIFYLSV